MKKVLHVCISFRLGGTESFVLNYASHLCKEDMKIDVYCPGQVDDSQVDKLNSYGGKLFKGILPTWKRRKDAYKQFLKFLKQHHYDVVHCNCNFDSDIYVKAAKKAGVKMVIAHSHDDLSHIKTNFIRQAKEDYQRKRIIKYSDKLLACSNEAGSYLFKKAFKNGTVIKNILNNDCFEKPSKETVLKLKKEYQIPNDAFIIGNISRFEEKKNQGFLLKTLSIIMKEKPGTILILGGPDGGTLEPIKEQARMLGLEHNVRFVGPQKDIKPWLEMFDIFAFPSLFEGFGIVLLEAQALGKNVIASPFAPDDVNQHLGLFQKVELDENKWLASILGTIKSNINSSSIKNVFSKKGFIDCSVLKDIYNS